MDASDFPPLSFPRSLFRLAWDRAVLRARSGISMVTALSRFKLDRAWDPGWAHRARHFARHAVACWHLETIGPLPRGHFGTSAFTAAPGRHSTSLAFAPTHQASCCQCACKARYRACG